MAQGAMTLALSMATATDMGLSKKQVYHVLAEHGAVLFKAR
jgi:hypothetical protein